MKVNTTKIQFGDFCQSLCDASTVLWMNLVNFVHICVPRRRPVSHAAPAPASVINSTASLCRSSGYKNSLSVLGARHRMSQWHPHCVLLGTHAVGTKTGCIQCPRGVVYTFPLSSPFHWGFWCPSHLLFLEPIQRLLAVTPSVHFRLSYLKFQVSLNVNLFCYLKEARWSGWVWVGECSFWYRPTRVVPDQRPLNGLVQHYTFRQTAFSFFLKYSNIMHIL